MQDKLDFVGQMNISGSQNDALNVHLKFPGTNNLLRKFANLAFNVIVILGFSFDIVSLVDKLSNKRFILV
jgi:hypothetical protein